MILEPRKLVPRVSEFNLFIIEYSFFEKFSKRVSPFIYNDFVDHHQAIEAVFQPRVQSFLQVFRLLLCSAKLE